MSSNVKIIINLIFVITLFFINSWIGYGIMVGILLLTCAAIKMPIREVLSFILKLSPILIFTGIMNLFFVQGNIIFSWGIINIAAEGIEFAIKMIIRIICIIWAAKILIYTTTPINLAKGLESLLAPLKVLKFPVHEFSMIISISLRFIPLLEEELKKIMDIQKMRGAGVGSKNIIKKIGALKTVIIPLIISILRRSEQIAIAMESRCYT